MNQVEQEDKNYKNSPKSPFIKNLQTVEKIRILCIFDIFYN